MSDDNRCGMCGEALQEDGGCINRRYHDEELARKKHERQMEDATDVLVDLFHSAQRIAAVQPNCETLLRSLLRASEYLRAQGVRR